MGKIEAWPNYRALQHQPTLTKRVKNNLKPSKTAWLEDASQKSSNKHIYRKTLDFFGDIGYVPRHGHGYPANAHKLRTGQSWWSVCTSTHQFLFLNETGTAPSQSREFKPTPCRYIDVWCLKMVTCLSTTIWRYTTNQHNEVDWTPVVGQALEISMADTADVSAEKHNSNWGTEFLIQRSASSEMIH